MTNTYFNIFQELENSLLEKNPLSTDKMPYQHPSSAMCYSAVDNTPIGACLRSLYLKHQKTPSSNPMGIYVKMATEAGNLWESWLIERYKLLGIYLSDSIKVFSDSLQVSGEIDIYHRNLNNPNEHEITECKQYNGSNYYAVQELKGSKFAKPKPKDQNLLQVFDYLLVVKDTISRINLVYIDRSCSSYSNNIQFIIELEEIKGKIYPKISFFNYKGEIESYVDPRINNEVLADKRNMLKQFIEIEQIPPRDYFLKYTKEDIEIKLLKGEISKTRYNKYLENPSQNYIGDWMCKYCPYGPGEDGFSVCESLEEK